LATLVRERDRPEVDEEERPAQRRAGGRLGRIPPLALHAAAFGLLLLALAPLLHLQTAWVGDEGAYAMQVQALRDGHWEYDYAGQEFDPKGSWFPLATGEGFNYRFDGRFYSYVKHPTYILLQRISVGAFGEGIGFHLPAMAGALLCAIAAWLLAEELAGRAQRLAFWLAASGPVIFNAYVMWAHALSAGIAGLTLLVGLRLAKGRWSLTGLAGLASGVILLGLVRAEGVLFGLALALPLGLLAWRALGPARATAVVAVTGAGAAVARLGGARLVDLVVRGPYGSDGVRGGQVKLPYLEGRWTGAYHVLVQGSEATVRAARLSQLGAVLIVAGALLLRGRWRPTALAGIALMAAGVYAVALRFHEFPFESVTGLFVAWPVVFVGLLAHRKRTWSAPATAVAGVLMTFLTGVVLTQYAIGGGLEWGGRFLSPLGAPVAALGAVGMADVVARHRSKLVAVPLVAALAAAAVIPAASGLRLLEKYRTEKGDFHRELAARSDPVIVIGILGLVELPRQAWAMDNRFDWIMAPSPGDVPVVLEKLRANGFRDVTLLEEKDDPSLASIPYPVVHDVTGPRVAGANWVLLSLHDGGGAP